MFQFGDETEVRARPRLGRRCAGAVLLTIGLSVAATGCFGESGSSVGSGDALDLPDDGRSAGSTAESSTSSTTTTSTTTTSTTTTSTTTTSTTTTTTTTLPPTTTTTVSVLAKPLKATYRRSNAELKRVQERLLELGFWLPSANGKYGLTTRHAVLAFQKYHELRRTGAVDPATAKMLTNATERVQARTKKGNAIEVDKTRQVLFLVKSGRTEWVFNTSTGSGQWFIEPNVKKPGQWEWGRSITPSGKFSIQYQRKDGWWEGDLGKIYRPKYFNGGIAIHGMHNVPAQPASHGCVRLGLRAMDYLWKQKWVKKGLRVWVYGEDVEARNKPTRTPPTTTTRPPSTTSSTTTTTTTTTAAPTPG